MRSDITPHDGVSREDKHRREENAMRKFTSELLPAGSVAGQRIWGLWQEYEEGQTREAKFVKDLVRFHWSHQKTRSKVDWAEVGEECRNQRTGSMSFFVMYRIDSN